MRFWTICGALVVAQVGLAGEQPKKHVLAIGIDGLRADALAAAETPHLDQLIEQGSFSDSTRILGSRYRRNNTISGPGWSSFLTGVWADKHGVHDNTFTGKNYQAYPHFFARLKQQFPKAVTWSFVDWVPIDTHIVTHADLRRVYQARDAESYVDMDARIAEDASELLAQQAPHAAMVYFGAVDETGHRHGFHPSVPRYIQAIEQVDRHVGKLVSTLRSRSQYEQEDWLVIVSTDHGGQGKGHGDGQEIPEIYTTFLIVSGQSAKKGTINAQTYVVDVPVTALVHLGVEIDPAWGLDGRAVGLRGR